MWRARQFVFLVASLGFVWNCQTAEKAAEASVSQGPAPGSPKKTVSVKPVATVAEIKELKLNISQGKILLDGELVNPLERLPANHEIMVKEKSAGSFQIRNFGFRFQGSAKFRYSREATETGQLYGLVILDGKAGMFRIAKAKKNLFFQISSPFVVLETQDPFDATLGNQAGVWTLVKLSGDTLKVRHPLPYKLEQLSRRLLERSGLLKIAWKYLRVDVQAGSSGTFSKEQHFEALHAMPGLDALFADAARQYTHTDQEKWVADMQARTQEFGEGQ